MSDTLQTVRRVIADIAELELEEVFEEATLTGDLEVDSLMMLEIMVDLEQELGLTLMDQYADNVFTVKQLAYHIDALKENANQA